jgi:hypothetical protein
MVKYLAVLGLMLLPVAAQARDDFLQQLSPADFAAAGLTKQTPAELARLKALVEQYKSGELAEVRQAAAAQLSLKQQEADRKVAEAEKKARVAEAKATQTQDSTEPAKKQPRWFSALLTLDHAGSRPEKEEALESRLVGDFSGWHGTTSFTLENGTRWVQQNKSEIYDYAPVLHAPKVKIKPAAMSGFWLQIDGVNLNVRVRPLDLAAH